MGSRGEDDDRAALLGRIVDVLVAGSYLRARNPSISPFDKLTGGIAWCIAASDVNVEYQDLEYDEEATLGEKIEIAEAIVRALQRMNCPHPLQAHQIQGLDYPAVLPVVQWLVKRVLATREELGDRVRDYSQFHLFRHRVARSRSDEATKQQIRSLNREIELCEERLAEIDGQSSLADKLRRVEEQVKRNQALQSEIAELQVYLGDPSSLETILQRVQDLKIIEKEKASFMEVSKREQDMQLVRLKELKELAKMDIQDPRADLDRKARLRTELANVSRAVILLRRRLEDVPAASELMQYEHCFMELYVNIQAKHRETRKYFASYNALAEANELCAKEISLLNSINSKFEVAMSSPGNRENFLESMQGLAHGVQQKLARMNARYEEKKTMYDALKEKHAANLARKRQYYNLVRQLQEEYAKNERLHQQNQLAAAS